MDSAGQFTLKKQWISNLVIVDRQPNPTTGIKPYSGSAGQFTLKKQWVGNLVIVDRQAIYTLLWARQPLHWHTLLWVSKHTLLWVGSLLHWQWVGPIVDQLSTGIPYCGWQAYPIVGQQASLSTGIPYCGSASIPYCGSAASPLAYPIVGQAYPIVGRQPLHWHTLLWVGKHTLIHKHTLLCQASTFQATPNCGSSALAQAKPNCGLST